jgi:hypothetical protein
MHVRAVGGSAKRAVRLKEAVGDTTASGVEEAGVDPGVG